MQQKHFEWFDQWSRFKDDSVFLLKEWIYPVTLEDFRGKRVLDAGCGHGHHLLMVAPYAREAVGLDLNTAEIASAETKHLPNVKVFEGDLARFNTSEKFDIVYCVGVIQHTDDPDKTFENLKRLTRPGGTLIIWVYSHEGNFLNRTFLEWAKVSVINRMPSSVKLVISFVLTVLMYPVVWTVYRLPFMKFLPFYEYFEVFRILPFVKNFQNVFDKLIAPQTIFLKEARVRGWFSPESFESVHVSHYRGISWRCSGKLRQ